MLAGMSTPMTMMLAVTATVRALATIAATEMMGVAFVVVVVTPPPFSPSRNIIEDGRGIGGTREESAARRMLTRASTGGSPCKDAALSTTTGTLTGDQMVVGMLDGMTAMADIAANGSAVDPIAPIPPKR